MAAVSLGIGLSGILMNILEGVFTFISTQSSDEGSSTDFKYTLYFYIITALSLFGSGMMFFVERNNKYAMYYYKKQEMLNK